MFAPCPRPKKNTLTHATRADEVAVRPQSAFRPRIDSAATVRELGNKSHPIFAAKVLASEGKRLTLQSSEAAPIGAAVRVDVEGGLIFGEVVQSRTGVQGCTVIVNIDQVIPSVSDLTNLLGSIFGNERQTSMRATADEMAWIGEGDMHRPERRS